MSEQTTENCEAMNVRGQRCRHPAAYTVDLDGAPHRVCGAHAVAARRGSTQLYRERPPAEPSPGGPGQPWTEEEDAVLADPDMPAKEVSARTGRTVGAVRTRRWLKRRGLL